MAKDNRLYTLVKTTSKFPKVSVVRYGVKPLVELFQWLEQQIFVI